MFIDLLILLFELLFKLGKVHLEMFMQLTVLLQILTSRDNDMKLWQLVLIWYLLVEFVVIFKIWLVWFLGRRFDLVHLVICLL